MQNNKSFYLILTILVASALLFFLLYDSGTNKDNVEDFEAQESQGEEKGMKGIYETLEVANGDTIQSIAQDYGISKETVIQNNNLKTDQELEVGLLLRIPFDNGLIILIKEGDTLESIAQEYDVEEQVLADYNWLNYPYSLTVDSELFIPKEL